MPATKFEKGKVKEKIDPKVLSALSTAFGYKVDDVDDLDYEEYHNELREAIQIGKESLSSTEMGLLVMERKRIRSEKSVYKEDFKEKKTIMTAADIKKGSAMQLAENSALSLYKGGVGQSPEETDDNLGDIEDKLDDILESLKEEGELDADKAKAAKKKAEEEKRAKKEKNLERWKALKTTASKIVKPFRSLWDKVWGFISKILIGSALVKIIKWMGDKKNQDKLESIGKFFKDWWPTMLAAYLLFGNTFGRMAVKLTAMFVKFSIKFVTVVIPALIKAIAKLKIGKLLNKIPGGGKWGSLLKMGTLFGGGLLLEKGLSGDFSGDSEDSEEVQKFNKGGQVPGRGNTDTVPAMLTPGEFVMSKGAVQKYGVNTMESMNAAAGGTNRPTMGRYNEGGKVQTMSEKLGHTRGTVTDPKERQQQEAYMLKYVNEERIMQGLEPLNNLTYAPGVELTKMMGPGPKTTETSDTDINLDTGMKSTWKTKSRGGETIFQGSTEMITEEDRQQFFAENPHAAQLVQLKDQMELDALGADISASAKMNGGGLVPKIVPQFNGGGLVPKIVPQFNGGGLVPIPGFAGGGQVRLGGRSGAKMRLASKTPEVKTVNPPVKKSSVVTTQEIQNISKEKQVSGGASSKIPAFNAEKYISIEKISTLGMTV